MQRSVQAFCTVQGHGWYQQMQMSMATSFQQAILKWKRTAEEHSCSLTWLSCVPVGTVQMKFLIDYVLCQLQTASCSFLSTQRNWSWSLQVSVSEDETPGRTTEGSGFFSPLSLCEEGKENPFLFKKLSLNCLKKRSLIYVTRGCHFVLHWVLMTSFPGYPYTPP